MPIHFEPIWSWLFVTSMLVSLLTRVWTIVSISVWTWSPVRPPDTAWLTLLRLLWSPPYCAGLITAVKVSGPRTGSTSWREVCCLSRQYQRGRRRRNLSLTLLAPCLNGFHSLLFSSTLQCSFSPSSFRRKRYLSFFVQNLAQWRHQYPIAPRYC